MEDGGISYWAMNRVTATTTSFDQVCPQKRVLHRGREAHRSTATGLHRDRFFPNGLGLDRRLHRASFHRPQPDNTIVQSPPG